jgi:acetyl esterase/lipase
VIADGLRRAPHAAYALVQTALVMDEALMRVHDALANAGVAVRCEMVAALWHGFHLHAAMLPAANAAIERVGRFISCSTS